MKKIAVTVYTIEKSLRHHVIEWTATVLSMIGGILNAGLATFGAMDTFYLSFYVWSISDLFWISFALKHKHWGVLVTFITFLIINILAILHLHAFV